MENDSSSNDVNGESLSTTAAEYQAHLENKRKNCVAKLVQLLEHEIPEKISQLDGLIESGFFEVEDSNGTGVDERIPVPVAVAGEKSHETPSDKKGKPCTILFPNGEVTCNQNLDKFAGRMKQHLMDQGRILLAVSNQLTLIVPKMESGNTFGLMILGTFFMNLVKFINDSQADLSIVMKFNRERTNLIAKISHYPHCQDVRAALENYDDEHTTRFQTIAEQLRMRYCVITDLYLKNKERIHMPIPENPMDMF